MNRELELLKKLAKEKDTLFKKEIIYSMTEKENGIVRIEELIKNGYIIKETIISDGKKEEGWLESPLQWKTNVQD